MKKLNYQKQLRILKNTLYIITLVFISLIMMTSTKTLAETPANPAFTDYNFYKCVVDEYNDENDTSLPYTTNLTDVQLQTITSLSCYGLNKKRVDKISNIQGIEKLTLLTYLDIRFHNLSSIDLSHNTALTYLYLNDNNLSSIDLSNNAALTYLDLSYNNLSSIDLSSNILLISFNLSNNNISSIKLNTNIINLLNGKQFRLNDIDFGNSRTLTVSSNIQYVYNSSIFYNSNIPTVNGFLNEITVNNLTLEIYNGDTKVTSGNIEDGFILKVLSGTTVLQSLAIKLYNSSSFADYNFYKCVVDEYNDENDTSLPYTTDLTDTQLQTKTSLSCDNSVKAEADKISNAQGIEKLVSLTYLNLQYNNISSIDLSANTALTDLYIVGNNISSIDLNHNTKLKYLWLNDNYLDSINLSTNTKLTNLRLYNNNLGSINLSANTALTSLDLYSNHLSSIDLSANTALTNLNLSDNNLSSINLSNNTALTNLGISFNNLSSIDVSANTALTTLDLDNNNLSSIDLSHNPVLTDLDLHNNNLSSIDLSHNPLLTYLLLYNNPLSLGTVRIIKDTSTKSDVILPSAFPITYTIADLSIASYSSGSINGLATGTTNITGTFKDNSVYTTSMSGTIKVFDITSSKYNINKSDGYIFTGTDTGNTILDNVTIPIGTGSISGNKLQLKDEDILVEEYDIVSYNSSTYDLNQNYINAGTGPVNLDNITVINGTKNISGNKLQIKYGDTVLKEYDIVSYNSSTYDLNQNYINVGTGSVNLDNITVINGTKNISGNKLQIKYGDTVLKEYDIVSYNSSTYDLNQNNVIVNPDDDNTDILNNITVSNCTKEMTSGKLVIKYEGTTIKEYNIAKLNPGTLSSNLDMNKGIIKGITVGSKVSSLNGITVTGGTISKLDKNNNSILDTANLKTGDKLRITFSDNSYYDYTVSVKGDVDGSGTLTLTDIMKIANYVYKDQTKLVGAYLVSADYNGDGNYLLSDIMTLAHQVYKGED